MTARSKSQQARIRNAAKAVNGARADGCLLSPVILTPEARDALAQLRESGWTIRDAVATGLVLLAQRERERETQSSSGA